MQFKEQKGRVQVLAYDGYDKEKRRAIVKMLGSFDRYDYSLSVGLLEKMTVEQKTELQSEIDRRRQSDKSESDSRSVGYVHIYMNDVADCITNGRYDSQTIKPEEIWAAMDRIAKSLKKAGFKKPSKTPPERVLDDQPSLPLGSPAERSEKSKEKA
jgi:hypothetical protein